MQLFIQFPDFSNTSALDSYIEKRLKTLHKRLDARFQNPKISLRGAVTGRASDGRPKEFMAELMVKLPKSKKPFITKKKSIDFRTALTEAADAMEAIIRRDSEKAERSRKTVGKSLFPVRKVKRQAALP